MNNEIKKIREKITKMINQEENNEKRAMLNTVFSENLEYANERQAMIQLGNIIDAMKVIDRRFFVLRDMSAEAYENEPLSIGYGQTISQPSTVARMLLLSDLEPKLKVLEIGAGSGWNASLAAKLVYPSRVMAIERIKPLAELSGKNFDAMEKSTNANAKAEFLHGDALNKKSKIWKNRYDRIIATAGADATLTSGLQEMGNKLLKDKGLLLYPTNEFGSYGALELWKKEKNKMHRILREKGYAFVPLLRGEER